MNTNSDNKLDSNQDKIQMTTIDVRTDSNYNQNVLNNSVYVSESERSVRMVHHYSALVVLKALILTLAIFIALTLFTFQSKYDFTAWGALLGFAMYALAGSAIIQHFFPFGSKRRLIISVLIVFVFFGYVIFDTFMISDRMSPEDYLVASVALYIDFIGIFTFFLGCFGGGGN
ncbi:hypothetical protein BB559_002818 [Furculomyces boomerangus]|uniref:Uncharacterized protein n=2 Tax=Harpellales TaxID=61421 RepID=A0A2T9YS65_9FUNG|nr:hypothetical protein BB559_002818 [Furculomyces boomerangus]PVZ96870.1 hypothetical protein BB558_007204 [Smittium angustum]